MSEGDPCKLRKCERTFISPPLIGSWKILSTNIISIFLQFFDPTNEKLIVCSLSMSDDINLKNIQIKTDFNQNNDNYFV